MEFYDVCTYDNWRDYLNCIGDYWGIEKFDKSFNDGKGTSVILVNNQKGKSFLNSTKGDWKKLRKTPLEIAINGNRQIVDSSVLTNLKVQIHLVFLEYLLHNVS